MSDKGSWIVRGQREVFNNRVKLVEYDIELESGEQSKFIVHEEPDSAALLSEVRPGVFLFANQYRFPLRKTIVDLVGGGVRPGEKAEDAIVRECVEEVGLRPLAVTPLGTYFQDPGRSTRYVHLFYSSTFKSVLQAEADEGRFESIARLELCKDEVESRIAANEFHDPGILIAWSLAKCRNLV